MDVVLNKLRRVLEIIEDMRCPDIPVELANFLDACRGDILLQSPHPSIAANSSAHQVEKPQP